MAIKSQYQSQQDGSHYMDRGIQPIEYNLVNKLPFCEGNVVKYVTRHTYKGKEKDLKKAIEYLQFMLEEIYCVYSEIKYESNAEVHETSNSEVEYYKNLVSALASDDAEQIDNNIDGDTSCGSLSRSHSSLDYLDGSRFGL